MFKSLAVSTLILGSALAVVQPQVASARDRDDYRFDRDRRAYIRHEREERRERERWEQRRFRAHRGYYDRWGNWHWY
jgi:hypothetical protein